MNQMKPVDFHCHGIGRFDFAEPDQLVLDEIEISLRTEGVKSIVTLYLPKSKMKSFGIFMEEYFKGVSSGRYTHIVGVALEGPVLSSFGGTPESGCWMPTKKEWMSLFSLGSKGLTYVVISADAVFPKGSEYPDDILWVIEHLLRNNIRPALGHFTKGNPEKSALAIRRICNYVHTLGLGPIVTDHLFNDMPLNFKHCWRTREEQKCRDTEIKPILSQDWRVDNMHHYLGPVPAEMIKYAKRGDVKICMNFDGEHVDIDLCKKAVRLIGAENMLLMTDRIQSQYLGGQKLSQKDENELLYQEKGIVAGGSQSVMKQITNMFQAGFNSEDIYRLAYLTPIDLLDEIHNSRSMPETKVV